MEQNKNNSGVIVLLVVVIFILTILCVLFATDTITFNSKTTKNNNDVEDKNTTTTNNGEEDNKIDISMLYGTYTWSKSYTNADGKEVNLNIKLVLNSDGTATYNASDGYESEMTKGSFVYQDMKVIYTREYYNYPGQENSKYDEENSKTEIFNVVDKNTLQNVYREQQTSLIK